jgi:hypothetical protein
MLLVTKTHAEDQVMNTGNARNLFVAALVGVSAFSVSDGFWTTMAPGNWMSQAEARIGRPLTPFSVAGVARRTTRRAVWAGAVTGGALGLGYGYGYGYGDPYNYGGYSNYGYGYSNPYNYGYSSYGYGSAGYGSAYPYYGAGYGYYRPWGWRRAWW